MYEKYYQEYCNEVHKALGTYLFWRMIQNKVDTEPEVLSGLNKTPLSWIMIRHSLQVTLFMTLGRIFDVNGDSFSVDDLLKCCIEEVNIFSKKKLKDRKLKDQKSKKPDWLDDLIANAHAPTKTDFQMLRSELVERRKVFELVYQPIRHRLFAHNDKELMGKADQLWTKTKIRQLEEIIWFLHDLKRTLFETYENGKVPKLQNYKPDVDFYESDYATLLDLLKIHDN